MTGAVFTINGVSVKADDLLANASSATNQANVTQFKAALDLYYVDHSSYPDVTSGAEMINVLKDENYISENAPVNPDIFDYQVKNDGQNYSLETK